MPVTREDFTPGVTSGDSITTTLDAGEYSLQQVTEGFKIPQYSSIKLTYVNGGNGDGEIQTVTYYRGASQVPGQEVAKLTLTYDVNNNLSTVTRSDN